MDEHFFFPLLGFVFVAFFGVMGTVRWYLGQKLKQQVPSGQVDPARLLDVEARVAELEERVDFTERVLARGGGESQGR